MNLFQRALTLRGIVFLAWCAFVIWAAVITTLSSISGQEVALFIRVPGEDKLVHFTAFAFGAVTLCFAMRASTRWPWGVVVVLSILGIAICGALDEYHQLYTAGRSGGDVLDWLADALGGIFGSLSLLVFLHDENEKLALAAAGR